MELKSNFFKTESETETGTGTKTETCYRETSCFSSESLTSLTRGVRVKTAAGIGAAV